MADCYTVSFSAWDVVKAFGIYLFAQAVWTFVYYFLRGFFGYGGRDAARR